MSRSIKSFAFTLFLSAAFAISAYAGSLTVVPPSPVAADCDGVSVEFVAATCGSVNVSNDWNFVTEICDADETTIVTVRGYDNGMPTDHVDTLSYSGFGQYWVGSLDCVPSAEVDQWAFIVSSSGSGEIVEESSGASCTGC